MAGLAASAEARPEASCLEGLLRRHAEVAPEAGAILAPGRPALDYATLYRYVSQAVETLNDLGIGRGDRVALVLPNGPEMAVAFLAVSACAASAPLNPGYRESELDFYLSDLEPRALVLRAGDDSPARDVARARRIPVVELAPPALAAGAAAGLSDLDGRRGRLRGRRGFAGPGDVALVLHTSGTTSRPKIVPLTHANLCASAANVARTLSLDARDRCLNVMPLFHIHGLVAAVLASLGAGGSVVCTPGFDPEAFFEWIAGQRPSWFTAVPTMHQAILARAAAHRDEIGGAPLRFIRSSSASLPPSMMAELERVFRVPVIESYGMTEAAHQMASNPLPPRPRKPGSVGLAAGPELAIMDEAGELLPTGSIGEVVIRGANVTAGYERNPEANAGAFCRGWFRTGDQGRIDSEGYLFLTGRLKEMINRGGEKIAPREVDEAFLAHPAIAQAVAFAVPHPTLGEDLAVAVVLAPGAETDGRELRAHAFERLAGFKVPSRVVIVGAIPKGPTGKLQRIGLHEKLEAALQTRYEAPGNELEALLAGFYAEVLGQTRVGALDDFFALGGDSLLATRIVSRIRRECHVELPIETVFRRSTPRELAREVAEAILAGDPDSLEGVLAEIESLTDAEAQRLLKDA